MRNHLIAILVVAMVSSWWNGHALFGEHPPTQLKVLGEMSPFSQRILHGQGQPISNRGSLLVLDIADRDRSMRNFVVLAYALRFRHDVLRHNMAHFLQTSPFNGQPYSIFEVQVDDASGNVVGIRKEVRQINLTELDRDLRETRRDYHTATEILQRLDASVVVALPEL